MMMKQLASIPALPALPAVKVCTLFFTINMSGHLFAEEAQVSSEGEVSSSQEALHGQQEIHPVNELDGGEELDEGDETAQGEAVDPIESEGVEIESVALESAEAEEVEYEVTEEDEEDKGKDPWSAYNRVMFKINDKIDTYAIRPAAVVYSEYVPTAVQRGVQNFFFNIGEVVTIPNDLLQGKFKQAGNDSARLLFNTVFGLVGVFDIATELGLERHEEDFGQTFAHWGIPQGPYVVLPLFGPSTLRDAVGLFPEYHATPTSRISDDATRYGLAATQAIDFRASLLESDSLLKGDQYIFFREAYLQRRDYLINDGVIEEDPFLDEEW